MTFESTANVLAKSSLSTTESQSGREALRTCARGTHDGCGSAGPQLTSHTCQHLLACCLQP